jgi:hypothetical protein
MSETHNQHRLDIDVLKAILVIGMVLDHAVVLLGDKPTRVLLTEPKNIVTIVSFSGFLFCFGYTTWLAYFSTMPTIKRVFTTVLRILVVYYVSGYFYALFVERQYSTSDLLSVLILSRLMPFAEFMLGFALTLAAGFLFYKPIGFLLERPRLFFLTVSILLLTTFMPTGFVRYPQISLFIGSSNSVAASFPVLQYFPLYLMGMYFARYNVRPNLLVGLAGIGAYYLSTTFLGPASRFPPDIVWIIGSAFFVLTWYAIAQFISRWVIIDRLLATIGVNVLYYLLMSNILLFAFRGAMPKLGGAMSLKATIEVSFALLATIYFINIITRRVDIDKIIKEPQPSTSISKPS